MNYEKFLSSAIGWLKDRLGERSTRIGLAAAACGVVMAGYAMSRGEDSSALVGIVSLIFGIVSAATPDKSSADIVAVEKLGGGKDV